MSKSSTQKRQWLTSQPADPGSKRWYREKKIQHSMLWLLPLLPAAYTLSSQGVDMPWAILVWMLVPVAGSGVALAFVSHALWRIEINVAGNREHPFTDKDNRVLGRSGWIVVLSLLFAVAVDGVARLILGDSVSDAQLRFIDTSTNTAVIVGFVGATLAATMRRIHCKAKHAYDELEKGV